MKKKYYNFKVWNIFFFGKKIVDICVFLTLKNYTKRSGLDSISVLWFCSPMCLRIDLKILRI